MDGSSMLKLLFLIIIYQIINGDDFSSETYTPRRTRSRWFSYPQFSSMYSILQLWDPDVIEKPKDFTETLIHLNFSNITERMMAKSYRDLDVPFKIFDVPDLDRTTAKWTKKYLSQMLKREYQVERSTNKHFLYWTTNGKKVNASYKSPTEFHYMNISNWYKVSNETTTTATGDNKFSKLSQKDYYYLYINYERAYRDNAFIGKDMTFLCPKRNNLFIPYIRANRGVECRFSMTGIISETHFDAGRNMIAMVKGSKRYVLIPPNACSSLNIQTDIHHPSYRQSMIDFTNPEHIKASAVKNMLAIDTVINAGEILYIPSFWFHYIGT